MLIGIFPSHSHSQAAAIDPRIPAITKDPVASIDKVAYARRASPAPTASTTELVKESTEKLRVLIPSFWVTQKTPRSPSFKIKFWKLHSSFKNEASLPTPES